MTILIRRAESSRMDATLVKCANDPIATRLQIVRSRRGFQFFGKIAKCQRRRAAQKTVNQEKL